MKIHITLILFCLNIILCNSVLSQEYYPINQELHLRVERAFALNKSEVHTSFRPLIIPLKPDLLNKETNYFNYDSVLLPGVKPVTKERSWGARKLLSESFAIVDSSNFKIFIDPLLEVNIGKENEETSLFLNARGANISALIGKNLYINTSFIETQARYPSYITTYINKYGVAPGQTIVKDFKENAFDHAVAYGSISYTPYKFLNIHAGQGKHFIGDGYRSLFLSDNSYQYPFLKFTFNHKGFQFVSMATLMQNIGTNNIVSAKRPWESPFIKKPASFNYLSYSVNRKLQFSLFEGIMFRSPWGRSLSWKFFNPVILARSIRYTLDGENNIILGLNAKYQPFDKISLYGQLAIDDMEFSRIGKGDSRNRTGFQLGLKLFDPLGIKNLIIQQEFNQVRPYTYTHELSRQTYTAFNQPLAHPLGANFSEYISIIDYRYKRWHAHSKIIFAQYGADNPGQSWGQNIFKSDYFIHQIDPTTGNYTGQGKYTGISYILFKGSYILNPKTNLNISAGYYYRSKEHLHVDKIVSSCFFISIATNLFNQYLDF